VLLLPLPLLLLPLLLLLLLPLPLPLVQFFKLGHASPCCRGFLTKHLQQRPLGSPDTGFDPGPRVAAALEQDAACSGAQCLWQLVDPQAEGSAGRAGRRLLIPSGG
jgi:hypothetical protein